MSSARTSTSAVDRQLGRVKWFNNKAGYGFITATRDGTETDIFVHHSDVMVVNEQYKYLVQGEYVEFMASEVSGINGGKLMCETRNEFRQMKTDQPISSSREASTSREASSMPTESTQPWKFTQKPPRAESGRGQGRGSQGRGSQGRGPSGRSAGKGGSGSQ